VGTEDAEGIDDLWNGFKTLMRALQVQENDPDYLQPQSFKKQLNGNCGQGLQSQGLPSQGFPLW